MVEQVSFKNFRRFEDFPPLELGNINFFVGRNNAGKSTVLKALQLIKGNLNTLSNMSHGVNGTKASQPMFVFDTEEMAELHIDNFERALYNKAKRKEITLCATINECEFQIVLDGQNALQNGYYIAVPYNYIEIADKSIRIAFNLQTRDLSLSLEKTAVFDDVQVDLLNNELSMVQDQIEQNKIILSGINEKLQSGNLSGIDLVQMINQKQDCEKKDKFLGKKKAELDKEHDKLTSAEKVEFTISAMPDFADTISFNIIQQIFENIRRYSTLEPEIDGRSKEAREFKETQSQIKNIAETLEKKEEKFTKALSDFQLEYIHAHAASQKVIYLKNDRGDALSKALYEYCKAGIMMNDCEARFVTKWMGEKYFNIGEEYIIESVQSAGYTLQILEDREKLNLADKGTGSIQIMTLLLSLAVIMRKASYFGISPTILIEEPEQNIHPMLQSMLADMLQDFWSIMSEQSSAQLIVETHSEYLVRRTQNIVAKKKYHTTEEMDGDNPFRVFYFDKANAEVPFYQMRYGTNGRFIESFGSGFYDAAGQLSMELSETADKSEEFESFEFNWDNL